jgi:hypothetical protein
MINWEQEFCTPQSAVKRIEFFSARVSHIVLKGHWCRIIVLYVLAPSEEKSDI